MKNKKIFMFCTLVFFVLTAAAIMSGTAGAKSVYVIDNINVSPTPISAYDINGNLITYQNTYNVPYYGWGAVGLAIDSDNAILFVTYEQSNTIQMLDAETFADLGTTIAPGATNLAGIVLDHDNQLLYTIDRYTDNLYVYSWNASNYTLILQPGFPKDLPNAQGLYGIALDEVNDILYVADGYYSPGKVRYYDTATWTEQGNFSVAHDPVGIAVDVPNQFVYTVAGFEGSDYLSKYDLNTATETYHDMGHGGMGVAVDQATGLVYVSGGYSGDDLSVWDTTSYPFTQTDSSGDIGDPTGVCVPGREVSYNPLNLSKEDFVETCVNPGDHINYSICFDNLLNPYAVHNVTLVDTLPPQLDFISASNNGIYNSINHSVTWNIGTLTNGQTQQCYTLEVEVKTGTAPGTTITNSVKIDGDEVPPTTQNEITEVCETTDNTPPVTNKTVGDPKYGPNDEWVTSDTEFNMTAEDEENGSGVKDTYYRIWWNDSGVWTDASGVQVYDGNFTIGDYHEDECEHRIEYWSVDNANNEECHHNQTHYVDNSGPEQTYEYGDPKNETKTPDFVGIGPNTPLWLNSTDLGDCAVGSEYLSYEIWYGDELTEKTVYDGDPINDTNPEFGKISVLLDEWETCAHEIHFWCADYLGNGGGFTAFDFWVDAEGPTTESYFGDPHVIEETGFIWDWTWVNYTTIKFITATDIGCEEIDGAYAGVERIEWAVHLDADCDGIYEEEFWRQGVVYDNDENDTNDEVGVISMELSLYEDCCHLVVHTAYDYFGNEEPFDPFEMKQHVKVDGTEPEIYKTVGDPNCTVCPDCELGDYCVKTDTLISFYAEDYGCLWEYPEEHEGVGLDYVRYRIWNGTWGSWIYDVELDGESFYFTEECMHYLEIEAVDLLGNMAYDNETFFVDDTPPFIDKDVGIPYVEGDEIPDYWINCSTIITIDAWDEGCCNNLTYVGYNINDTGWVEITTLPETLNLPSCVHTLDIKAVDCLGNTKYDNETFYVDCDEPEIIKTVGDPNCTGCPNCELGDYCVKTDTLISFYAEDRGCQGGVGLFYVRYRIWNSTAWGPWVYDSGLDGESFYFLEECEHYLEIEAVDVLGNMAYDNETFFVDDTPPDITKIVGDPNVSGSGEPEDYWVSCNTPIIINANDMGCCGYLTNVSYRINGGNWIPIIGNLPKTVYFSGDCEHTLDIVAKDCLGNTRYHNETFYVDCQPPIVEKEVGYPKCTQGLPEGAYYVTKDTRIWINATENYTFDPCAIDEIHMLVGVYYDGLWHYTWYNETDDDWIRVDFTFDELGVGDDCVHYVTYYVVDKLGNYVEDNETFYVDNTPPETVKSFEGPTYDDNYWLRDNDTWVVLNTTDREEPCDSGAKYLHVELWWASNGYDIDTLLWARDIYDGDEVNDTDDDYGEIQYKFQIYEDCLHEIRWYSVDCLGNVEECSEQQVNLFFDDFETSLDKWIDYSRVTRKNDFYSHDGYYAELESISDWKTAWMLTSIDTTGYEDITLSYWARTRSVEGGDRLRVKWRVGTSGDWTQVNAIKDNSWKYYTHDLEGAENQPVVQILFKVDCFWDYGLVDDVLVTGNTTMCTQQHRVDSTPPEIIKTVGEPSFTDDGVIWWVTTDTEITLDAVDHLDPCAVGVDTLQYRIWWRGRWSEWIDYTEPFSFEEGCTHYLEVNATDYLGNNVIDNETFIVHGSSGDDDPDVEIEYPTFLPVMTISDKTLEVKIYAHDEFTTWENLDVYLRVPGGRQNAPDLWYDVILGAEEDYYLAYVDIYNYKDEAQITLEAYAVDEDGNVGAALPVTFKVHSTTVFDTWMEKGWNLLTLLPNTGCNESVERIIASVEDSYDLIFHHIPLNGWVSYLKGAQGNSLLLMEGGKQYWVHITNEDGVRYYLAHPEVEIQYPIHEQTFTEDIEEINGFAWDSQDGITSVDLQLYCENDTKVKYYWDGSDWTTTVTDLPCVLGGGYKQSWYYNTTGVDWLDYTTYFATAIATDSFGCEVYDTINFSINFTKYMFSGTIFNDTDVTPEPGDWLWVAVFDHWPVEMYEFVAHEVVTEPTMPCSYSFMLRNGTYYAIAALFNASSTDTPYAVGAVYNLSLGDIIAHGPDATVIDGADVSGRDMVLHKIPITCDVEVTIDYPWYEPVVGDESLTITGTAYGPCSCVDVNDVEIAIYYTDWDDPGTYTYYWNGTGWQPPTIIYNPVDYVSGGCGTTDPLVCEYTIDDSFFHGGGSYIHWIHVKAKDQLGNEGENLSSFTVGVDSGDFESYWELNGDLTDSIGTNHGAAGGDVTPTTGQVNQGYAFDGTGDYIDINQVITGMSDWTWSGWIYPNASGWLTFYSEGDWVYFEIYINNGNVIVSMLNGVSWLTVSTTGNEITLDQWNHVTITLSGGGVGTGTLKIYVDGQEVQNGTGQVVSQSPTPDALIGYNVGRLYGQYPHPGPSFSGTLDEIAIFDRALSSEEIRQCYDNGYYGGFGYLGDI